MSSGWEFRKKKASLMKESVLVTDLKKEAAAGLH